MKKKFLAMLACVAVMTMAVSFCACGDKKEGTKENETVENTANEDVEDTSNDDSSDVTATGKYASVEEYLKSDIMQEQLKTVEDSLQGSGMKMELKADGNKMVYSYQYTEITKVDGMAEALETEMEAQASTFQSTADALKLVVDAEDLGVVIEYIDANGEMIYSREFTAQ